MTEIGGIVCVLAQLVPFTHWPPIPYFLYFLSSKSVKSTIIWPNVISISHFCGSRNLPTIMSWVEAQRPGVDGVNIITSDFVELTDFANIVIKLNNRLLSEQDRKARWHKRKRDKHLLTHSVLEVGNWMAWVLGISFCQVSFNNSVLYYSSDSNKMRRSTVWARHLWPLNDIKPLKLPRTHQLTFGILNITVLVAAKYLCHNIKIQVQKRKRSQSPQTIRCYQLHFFFYRLYKANQVLSCHSSSSGFICGFPFIHSLFGGKLESSHRSLDSQLSVTWTMVI